MNSKDMSEMIEIIHKRYKPFALSMVYSDDHKDLKSSIPFIGDFKMIDNRATAYVCENFACQAPINDVEQLKSLLL